MSLNAPLIASYPVPSATSSPDFLVAQAATASRPARGVTAVDPNEIGALTTATTGTMVVREGVRIPVEGPGVLRVGDRLVVPPNGSANVVFPAPDTTNKPPVPGVFTGGSEAVLGATQLSPGVQQVDVELLSGDLLFANPLPEGDTTVAVRKPGAPAAVVDDSWLIGGGLLGMLAVGGLLANRNDDDNASPAASPTSPAPGGGTSGGTPVSPPPTTPVTPGVAGPAAPPGTASPVDAPATNPGATPNANTGDGGLGDLLNGLPLLGDLLGGGGGNGGGGSGSGGSAGAGSSGDLLGGLLGGLPLLGGVLGGGGAAGDGESGGAGAGDLLGGLLGGGGGGASAPTATPTSGTSILGGSASGGLLGGLLGGGGPQPMAVGMPTADAGSGSGAATSANPLAGLLGGLT